MEPLLEVGEVALSIMGMTLLEVRGNAVVVFDSDGLSTDIRGDKIELLIRLKLSAIAGVFINVELLPGIVVNILAAYIVFRDIFT